jgi:hypothetical protein
VLVEFAETHIVAGADVEVLTSRGTREITKPGDTWESHVSTNGLTLVVKVNGGAVEIRRDW